VIYLDTSVVLASLLKEQKRPPDLFWTNQFISSRLLEYEVMVRVHANTHRKNAITEARTLLAGIALIDLDQTALARALEPFPIPIRTLDAIHLSTMVYLRSKPTPILVRLASYDKRLIDAAQALAFDTESL
jgi:predicted nucleic acid-binding protein